MSAAFVTLAAAAAGGCGSEAPQPESPRPPPTRLTVAFNPGSGALAGDREPSTRTIVCPGHELCGRLARTQRDAFDPVPSNAACTAIYGGPETATVDGRLRGTAVHARFSRRNGCEINRWDRLEWLLVP